MARVLLCSPLEPTESNIKFHIANQLAHNAARNWSREDDDVIHKACRTSICSTRENRRLSNLFLPKSSTGISQGVGEAIYSATSTTWKTVSPVGVSMLRLPGRQQPQYAT